jgi:hypothetical protein
MFADGGVAVANPTCPSHLLSEFMVDMHGSTGTSDENFNQDSDGGSECSDENNNAVRPEEGHDPSEIDPSFAADAAQRFQKVCAFLSSRPGRGYPAMSSAISPISTAVRKLTGTTWIPGEVDGPKERTRRASLFVHVVSGEMGGAIVSGYEAFWDSTFDQAKELFSLLGDDEVDGMFQMSVCAALQAWKISVFPFACFPWHLFDLLGSINERAAADGTDIEPSDVVLEQRWEDIQKKRFLDCDKHEDLEFTTATCDYCQCSAKIRRVHDGLYDLACDLGAATDDAERAHWRMKNENRGAAKPRGMFQTACDAYLKGVTQEWFNLSKRVEYETMPRPRSRTRMEINFARETDGSPRTRWRRAATQTLREVRAWDVFRGERLRQHKESHEQVERLNKEHQNLAFGKLVHRFGVEWLGAREAYIRSTITVWIFMIVRWNSFYY